MDESQRGITVSAVLKGTCYLVAPSVNVSKSKECRHSLEEYPNEDRPTSLQHERVWMPNPSMSLMYKQRPQCESSGCLTIIRLQRDRSS